MNKLISGLMVVAGTGSFVFFGSASLFKLLYNGSVDFEQLLISVGSLATMYFGLNYVTGEWK